MEQIFTNIYENCTWGDNKAETYTGSSGIGSSINYNKDNYIPFLRNFIISTNIKTVVDLGCGDFRCGPHIYHDLDVKYTGYDAYKKVVDNNAIINNSDKYKFIHLDFCNKKEQIIGADLVIIKDVLQHWSLDDIYSFMDWLVASGKFKYVLIINCCYQQNFKNMNIASGGFRALTCDLLPLKKYNPTKVCTYHTKEISLITL